MTPQQYEARQIVQLLQVGVEIEGDLIETKPGIIKTLLACARKEAAEAITSLLGVDPEDAKKIRELQNIVNRQQDLAKWLSSTLIAAREKSFEIDQASIEEIEELMNPNPPMENDA